ncbi:MAG TPA: hypothetical protein VM511_03705 [Luteolibacter sp.]|nr:hypothetical protein [Luteolibacter sp.]
MKTPFLIPLALVAMTAPAFCQVPPASEQPVLLKSSDLCRPHY